MSELVAREEWHSIRQLERRVTMVILGLTVPATIILLFASEPIVRLLFQRGAFTAVETTARPEAMASKTLTGRPSA